MNRSRPLLLSPYRMPTNHQIHLGEEEVAAWLHGYLVLWHPALLHNSQGLPAVASAYDHDSPQAGDLFAAPENPPLYQADNWKDRVIEVGALAFAPQADWPATLDAVAKALEEVDTRWPDNPAHAVFRSADSKKLWETPAEAVFPFFGLGFGYLVVESLYDAMEHVHLLDAAAFESHLRTAAAELLAPTSPEGFGDSLRAAAEVLSQARESLSPGKIALLDFWELSDDSIGEIADSLRRGDRLTVLGSGSSFAAHGAILKEFFQMAEGPLASAMIGGSIAREEGFLPIESQLWNWREGVRQCREHLGVPPAAAASAITNFTPQTPSILKEHGIDRVWLTARDGAILPSYYASVVNWPGPDGKSVDGLTKSSQPAHEAASYFNLAYLLHQAIGADSSPMLIWLHSRPHNSAVHRAWRALGELGPALGQWQTAEEFFQDASAGEYAGTASADEIFLDYLEPRSRHGDAHPVSAFPRWHANRRRLDASMTMDAILAVLNRGGEIVDTAAPEAKFEAGAAEVADEFGRSAARLEQRISAGASSGGAGWMVLNPCGFTRRVGLELIDVKGPIPIAGAVKAADFKEGRANVVVEVPPLGYSWIPNSGKGQLPRTADKMIAERIIRNEFMEVEIDPATGGIRGIRDAKTKVNRVGQQLVFNPGSKMVADKIEHDHSGPVLAGIVSSGRLVDDHNETLATFVQNCRLWAMRPLLTVTVRIEPNAPPSGYPWNAYYASRLAWRDERAALFRGVNGMAFLTGHNRPQTPDYLEIRSGKVNTCLFPAGLPFHQKPNGRMLDTILICPGEAERTFTFHLALDRDLPFQTALGLISQTPCISTLAGQPAAGPSSWLFHVDAPNLLLTGMRPLPTSGKPGAAIAAQFQEIAGIGGLAEIRFVRNPRRAARVNGLGEESQELGCAGDAVSLEYSAHEMPRICAWFD